MVIKEQLRLENDILDLDGKTQKRDGNKHKAGKA